MDSSFKSWRQPEDDSESESDDFVEDSTSQDGIIVPDSDNDESVIKDKKEIKNSSKNMKSSDKCNDSVYSSDENENGNSSKEISMSQRASNSESKTNVSFVSDHSSPDQIIFVKKKNKLNKIIISDDEDETELSDDKQCSDTKWNTEISHKYLDSRDSSPFKIEHICSSTKLDNCNESSSNLCLSTNCSSDFIPPKSRKSSSIYSKMTILDTIDCTVQRKDGFPTVDLTLQTENISSKKDTKTKTIDLTLQTVSVSPKKDTKTHFLKFENNMNQNDDRVIILDSDSGEDQESRRQKLKEDKVQLHLSQELSSLKISPTTTSEQISKAEEFSFVDNKNKNNTNDYFSRIESLKAEEIRLKMEVGNVLKDIEATKSSLKTANLSALPDKGVRLQLHLKKLETQLRDLRYQQNTLANEILKLQFSSISTSHPQNQNKQLSKEFKLPTMKTDLNTMGKKALETHMTQQALTVDALRTLHKSLENCPSEDTFMADPKQILVELMPHQKHALAWLLWREKEKPPGGILADDMGLGKTLTMISLILKSNEIDNDNDTSNKDSEDESEKESAWMSANHCKFVEGKTLVVCPASLLNQWEYEIKNKVRRGVLDVLVHHGQNREKKARRLANPDVIITTYNIINRDSSHKESPLYQIRWERIILDEAHQIRNYKSQTAQAVFQLKARKRWALTGTPVHNKEIDLYALLKFLRCSPFDDLAVWKRWVDNRNAAGNQRLNTIIKSLMLRRTKQGLQEKGELKSLKNKTFNSISITLDKEEQTAYENLLNFSKTLFAQFLHQKAMKENALQGLPVTTKSSHFLQQTDNAFEKHPELARLHRQMKDIPDVKSHDILVLLLRLRQFCCHPALIKSMLDKDDVKNVGIEDDDGLDIDLMDKLTRISLAPNEKKNDSTVDSSVSVLSSENNLFAETRLSSKMRKVLEVVEDILTSGDKVILVSQWVSLLNLLFRVLKDRKVKCVMLCGSVPVKDRADIVEKFNQKGQNPRVMLLSLTAGGVGLNLVGGNHLLLIDLHWNPQLESQACDRIYRVGQEKDVQIYKFISSETIEERILKLQEHKLSIANDVLTGANHTSKLSLDDLKMLFQITN